MSYIAFWEPRIMMRKMYEELSKIELLESWIATGSLQMIILNFKP